MAIKKKTVKVSHRAHVFYAGRVQGVGFRYTAEKIALEIGLVGWVKNLPDNRVEIVCEGSAVQIQKFLEGIKTSFLGPYIKKVTCNWEKPIGQFKDFSVEFCC
ncbi:MAG: hypothetical protein AUJ72_02710 [Candidatus Omnitrophica bacterium CG1_02_46_14]|nr:MAG: hypothetical protein AUJ72_02710 [Candidatus Omnitrophica bacterium CG1_02_46_14]